MAEEATIYLGDRCMSCRSERMFFEENRAIYDCGTSLVVRDGVPEVKRTLRCQELQGQRKAIHEVAK